MAIISKYWLNWNTNDNVWWYNWTSTVNVNWVAWKLNQAGSFNWTTSRIDLPDNSSKINWLSTVSISCLVKLDTQFTSATWSIYSATNWWIWLWNHSWLSFSNGFAIYSWWSWRVCSSTSLLSVWLHHIVWTFNWNQLKLYIDWILNNTTNHAWTIVQNAWTEYIWHHLENLMPPPNWTIDEVIIYNNTLTPAEIKNQYAFYKWFI